MGKTRGHVAKSRVSGVGSEKVESVARVAGGELLWACGHRPRRRFRLVMLMDKDAKLCAHLCMATEDHPSVPNTAVVQQKNLKGAREVRYEFTANAALVYLAVVGREVLALLQDPELDQGCTVYGLMVWAAFTNGDEIARKSRSTLIFYRARPLCLGSDMGPREGGPRRTGKMDAQQKLCRQD